MKFGLVDRILELDRGKRIVTVKAVTLAEEYLSDHFPTFPVLPGVLMLEALIESAAWLVRDAQDFASSVILLKEAKNVTYKSFVKPGNLLTLEVSCRGLEQGNSEFTGMGFCCEKEVVRAKFSLTHFRASGKGSGSESQEERIVAALRKRFALLLGEITPTGQDNASDLRLGAASTL